jgi:RimJ/RimL family protein N-acetyltransferase
MWLDWHESSRHAELAVRRARVNFLRREVIHYDIWHREDGRLLGRVQLEDINWRTRTFGVGYWLRAGATGRGFATEAAILVCRLAFEKLEAIRVGIHVNSLNERSIAVPRRLAFSLEGRIRNERLDSAGRPQDTLIFGLTREDYFGGEINGWKDWTPLP